MNQLECMQMFVQVVEREGFSRAASSMQMSPAKMSTQIQGLEAHLGVQLLSRTTRAVALTEDGTSYYQHCKRVLADIAETEGLFSQSQGAPRGRLRIDASVSLTTRVLLPVLAAFRARYPDIQLELLHTAHLFDSQQEGLDVMLRLGPLDNSALIARPLGSAELITVAAPDYLARRGIPTTPQDLLQHECIAFIDPFTGRRRPWSYCRNGNDIAIAPHSGLAFNQGESRLAAAVMGLGVYQGVNIGLDRLLQDGSLVELLQDWTSPAPPIYVAYARHGYLASRTRAFVDFLVERYPPGRPISVPNAFRTDPVQVRAPEGSTGSITPLRVV
jgi:LysR family transcriptional regulator for bpeEF and oprC